MHIPPFDNQNKAIIDIHNADVPLTYFNIVKLEKGQVFSYQIPGYETCIVPATGSVDVDELFCGISILSPMGKSYFSF